MKCPGCKQGELRQVEWKGGFFYGCSIRSCRTSLSPKAFKVYAETGMWEKKTKQPYAYKEKPIKRGQGWSDLIEGTNEQQAVWESFGNGNSIKVDALAGTGKSTVLNQACNRISENCFIVVLSFAKRDQISLAAKLPPNSAAMTVHSLGLRALQRTHGVCYAVDKNKVKNILADVYTKGITDKKEIAALYASIRAAAKLIGLCRTSVLFHPSNEDVIALATRYGIECDGRIEEMVQFYMKEAAFSHTHLIRYGLDYDDMLSYPLYEDMLVDQADAVMVDEAQDLSTARQQLALKISDQAVIVGDTNQAIYRFSGADSASINNLAAQMNDPIVLPLTINWRCGANHVALIQKLVPELRAKPDAVDGIIQETTEDQFMKQVKPGHMVLSRTNKDMIPHVYNLLKQGTGATIKGKDFGTDLSHLIQRITARTDIPLKQFFPKLDHYLSQQLDQLTGRRNSETAIQILRDKVDTLAALCEGHQSTQQVLDRIESLFTEDTTNPKVVRFSTIHGAKGDENENVHVLNANILGTSKSKDPELQREERNILYVAGTRVWNKTSGSGTLSFVGGIPSLLGA